LRQATQRHRAHPGIAPETGTKQLLQFTHVAGIAALAQVFNEQRRQLDTAPADSPVDEMAHQQWNVLPTLCQCRCAAHIGRQAMEEICAETTCGNFSVQVAMSRAYQAEPGALPACRAHPAVGLFLQDAQKRRLYFKWQLAHLVQKQGPSVRCSHRPDTLGHSACVGAALVPEEFTASEFACQRGAVNHHQLSLVGPRVQGVGQPGQQFLAGARGPCDQQRRVRVKR
jgi:hypothetical protein